MKPNKYRQSIVIITLLINHCHADVFKDIGSYIKTGVEATKTVVGEAGYNKFKKHVKKHGLKNQFKEVADHINFADYHFVGTHNSFANKKVFKMYNQHWATITQQLRYGVRGFMIDTHLHKNQVLLCHGSCTGPAVLQTGSLNPKYETFAKSLRSFVQFLEIYPKEILYVNLENHAPLKEIQKVIKSIPNLDKYLFKHTDWSVKLKKQQWPTIGWMRKNNKRIIIVVSNRKILIKDYPELWSTFKYSFENNYSTVKVAELCQERTESTKYNSSRKIVIFNCFREVTGSLKKTIPCNSYKNLKSTLAMCRISNFANNQSPNGLFTDRTVASSIALKKKKEKTIFDLVNEMNLQEARIKPK